MFDGQRGEAAVSRAALRICLRALGVVLTLGLFAAPHTAPAQAPGKVPRVGYVFARVSSADERLWDAARQGLRELGYVEGQNITLEVRGQKGGRSGFPTSWQNSSVSK